MYVKSKEITVKLKTAHCQKIQPSLFLLINLFRIFRIKISKSSKPNRQLRSNVEPIGSQVHITTSNFLLHSSNISATEHELTEKKVKNYTKLWFVLDRERVNLEGLIDLREEIGGVVRQEAEERRESRFGMLRRDSSHQSHRGLHFSLTLCPSFAATSCS